MRTVDAIKRVREAFQEDGVSLEACTITDVPGVWRHGEDLLFYRELPDGLPPREPGGQFESPYRAWRAIAEPATVLAESQMAYGCPTCGAVFDHTEREAATVWLGGTRSTMRYSPTFAVCTGGHRFILEGT